MSFAGFDASAVALLRGLPGWGIKTYAARKARLKAGVVDPGAALIETVAEMLDADLTVVRRSSVSPLHRDLRFAGKDAARYKDHLLLTTWWGTEKKFAPTLWIRLDADQVGFASGMAFDPKRRERWRAKIGGSAGAYLTEAIEKVESGGRRLRVEVAGDQVKRVPAPWPADHPREDLLRRGSFQLRFIEPLPKNIETAAFAPWCAKRLERLLPVHEWLVKEVA